MVVAGARVSTNVQCTDQSGAAAQCPKSLIGVWSQDMAACESMGPFLQGLGVPWFVWPIVDQLHTALHITAPAPGALQIVDQTLFGKNTTSVDLDGSEVSKKTRGGRKSFMLSGHVTSETQPNDCAVITCRLFQRGEGWSTRMERYVEGGRLIERNVLTRPGEQDVVVVRHFIRADQGPTPTTAAAVAAGSGSTPPEIPAQIAEPQMVSQATEVAEVTRQRREWIGICGVLVAAGACGCARVCHSASTG